MNMMTMMIAVSLASFCAAHVGAGQGAFASQSGVCVRVPGQ